MTKKREFVADFQVQEPTPASKKPKGDKALEDISNLRTPAKPQDLDNFRIAALEQQFAKDFYAAENPIEMPNDSPGKSKSKAQKERALAASLFPEDDEKGVQQEIEGSFETSQFSSFLTNLPNRDRVKMN